MPEGPEVRVIVDWLRRQLSGVSFESYSILSGRYAKPGADPLNHRLIERVTGVESHGKLIGIHFVYGNTLASTLGMTGNWGFERLKHSRVSFKLSNGLVLYFTDVRNYGTLKLQPTHDFIVRKNQLGPDILVSSQSQISSRLAGAAKYFKKPVTLAEVLMDQALIAGIGNYLKCEILYAAKLSPFRVIQSLTGAQIDNLSAKILEISAASYSAGGSTLRNYTTPDGEPGGYANLLKIYGKTGPNVQKSATPDKRSTYWDPAVQL